MDFLDDAHKIRRVLRQNAASYEFSHRELEEYLKRAAESESPDRKSPRLNTRVYRELLGIWRVRSST
jgi:hypothetical protein